jgi:hypothetical protein
MANAASASLRQPDRSLQAGLLQDPDPMPQILQACANPETIAHFPVFGARNGVFGNYAGYW